MTGRMALAPRRPGRRCAWCRRPAGRRAALGFLAAVLAFFAVLALALALAAGRLAAAWGGEAGETATLQVFAAEDAIEEQARAALDVLRQTPGVRSVRMVDLAEQEKLLEPWLGPEIPDGEPAAAAPDRGGDRPGRARRRRRSRARLAEAAPGAVYDDHAAWRLPLVATAERLRPLRAGEPRALARWRSARGAGARGAGGGGGERAGDPHAAAGRGGGRLHRPRLRPAAGAARRGWARWPGRRRGCVARRAAAAGERAGLLPGRDRARRLAVAGAARWCRPAAAAIAWGAASAATRRGLRRWS